MWHHEVPTIWMWSKVHNTYNFSTLSGFPSRVRLFDNNAHTVIKGCREINRPRLGGVPFDLTYHISLKQHDYRVEVLGDFNTHVL